VDGNAIFRDSMVRGSAAETSEDRFDGGPTREKSKKEGKWMKEVDKRKRKRTRRASF
jgi:hypothetical protein